MDEGRKRTLTIAAAILIARHLKNPEDLYDSGPSPRTGIDCVSDSACGKDH